jgi:hypothetical protein
LREGKPALLFHSEGKAQQLRQQYQLVAKPGIACSIADRDEQWLHFVPANKHLGTVFTSDHGLDLEIRCRIGAAKATFVHLAKPLLTNKHLPLKTRLQLFQALVGTKLFFGLGSWRTPTPKQLQRLSGFLTNLLKKVMRVTPERWSIHGTCSCRRGHCWNPGTVSTGPFALCTAPLFGWPFLFESSGAFGICMFSSFMVGMLEGRLAMGL